MLPTLLWFVAGGLLALLAAIRLQLVLLGGDPEAGWLAVAAGLMAGGAIFALVCICGLRFRSWRKMGAVALFFPLLFLGLGYYGTTRYPARNFKTPEIAAEWPMLHPTLRLALWLVSLEDRRMVLTDIARHPREYGEMGLRRPAASPHYLHGDGYAHAVDLRVSNVGAARNWARQGCLLLMGLNAECHTGTADHLHLAL